MSLARRATKFASSFAIAASLSVTAAAAAPTVINFDDLGNGVLVTNQYAGVTFSSSGGDGIYTSAQGGFLTSPPNFICTGTSGGIDCTQDVILNFSGPVSGLSFNMTGDNNLGVIARANVFDGATLLGGVDIIGNGSTFDAQLIDLSAFSNISRLEIVNDTDAAGLAYDDFTFTAGERTVGVPEPLTLSLFGAGVVGAAWLRRRKAAKTA